MATQGAVMLARVAAELDHLVALSDDVQAGLGGAPPAPSLQGLDLLHQSLQALAVIVGTLAHAAPDQWPLDPERLLGGLSLADIRARLLGLPARAATAGHLELL